MAARAARSSRTTAAPLEHLHDTDISFAVISRAPLDQIEAYRAKRRLDSPWYSSYGSDFNYDFHVTLDEAVAPVEYNYRSKAEYEQRGGGKPTSSTASSRA